MGGWNYFCRDLGFFFLNVERNKEQNYLLDFLFLLQILEGSRFLKRFPPTMTWPFDRRIIMATFIWFRFVLSVCQFARPNKSWLNSNGKWPPILKVKYLSNNGRIFPKLKLKLKWPNQTLQMFQMKMTLKEDDLKYTAGRSFPKFWT